LGGEVGRACEPLLGLLTSVGLLPSTTTVSLVLLLIHPCLEPVLLLLYKSVLFLGRVGAVSSRSPVSLSPPFAAGTRFTGKRSIDRGAGCVGRGRGCRVECLVNQLMRCPLRLGRASRFRAVCPSYHQFPMERGNDAKLPHLRLTCLETITFGHFDT
jgi:hypothetical protein